MGLTKEIYIGGLHRYRIPPTRSKKKRPVLIRLLHISPRAIARKRKINFDSFGAKT